MEMDRISCTPAVLSYDVQADGFGNLKCHRFGILNGPPEYLALAAIAGDVPGSLR